MTTEKHWAWSLAAMVITIAICITVASVVNNYHKAVHGYESTVPTNPQMKQEAWGK